MVPDRYRRSVVEDRPAVITVNRPVSVSVLPPNFGHNQAGPVAGAVARVVTRWVVGG